MHCNKNENDASATASSSWTTRWQRTILRAISATVCIVVFWVAFGWIAGALVPVFLIYESWCTGKYRTRLVPELLRLEGPDERKRAWNDALEVATSGSRLWIMIPGGIVATIIGVLMSDWLEFALPNSTSRDSLEGVAVLTAISACGFCYIRFQAGRIRRELRRMLVERGHELCIPCGYDLTGNESGVCPECGTTIPSNEVDHEGQE